MSDSKRQSYMVRDLAEELTAWEQMRPAIAAAVDGDLEALVGTLEGETDLVEKLTVVIEEAEELKMQIAGISTRIADLTERKRRLSKGADTLREIVTMTMDRAGLDTIKSPVFTVSLRRTPPGLDITDEAKIPAAYWRQPDPVIDKKKLKGALDSGDSVPGVALDNGGIRITVRVK